MNPTELWNEFLKQAPGASDPDFVVKLKARGLKALLTQAYNEGAASKTHKPAKDMFSELFGKYKP